MKGVLRCCDKPNVIDPVSAGVARSHVLDPEVERDAVVGRLAAAVGASDDTQRGRDARAGLRQPCVDQQGGQLSAHWS